MFDLYVYLSPPTYFESQAAREFSLCKIMIDPMNNGPFRASLLSKPNGKFTIGQNQTQQAAE